MSASAIVYLIIVLFFSIAAIIWFALQTRDHNHRKKRLNDFIELNNKIIDWSKEIEDDSLKQKFLQERLTVITDELQYSQFDTQTERQKIVDGWAKHIPSLLQEIREEKLNKLKI